MGGKINKGSWYYFQNVILNVLKMYEVVQIKERCNINSVDETRSRNMLTFFESRGVKMHLGFSYPL